MGQPIPPQGQAPQAPKPPVPPIPPQGQAPQAPKAPEAPKMPEAPKAPEAPQAPVPPQNNEPAGKAAEPKAADTFDDIMKEMNKDSFSFIDDTDFQKIPPQMMKKAQAPQGQAPVPPQAPKAPEAPKAPAQQGTLGQPIPSTVSQIQEAPTFDPGVPQILMEAAEKVEAEKRARREAAASAAAAAAGPVKNEPVEDVTSLVNDSALAGNKIVPRLIRSKTGENIYITKPEFIIGKSKLHADYAIEHNTAVSREHCIVTREPSGANYIVDNKSTNGTYVNGTRIEAGKKQLLTDGTKVKLGDEEFIFKLRSGD